MIYFGYTAHNPVGTLLAITAEPTYAVNELSQVRDIFDGALRHINDGVVISPNGANLSLNRSAGHLYGLGLGVATSATDPSRIAIASGSVLTFQYRTQTGVSSGNITVVDSANYDVGGVVTAIPSANKWTNQWCFQFPSGAFRMQLGQRYYNSEAEAIAGSQSESFVVYPAFKDNALLVQIITVKQGATVLNSTASALFIPVSKFGERTGGASGSSTTTLQQAYDNSTSPEILTDATRGALTLKAGVSDTNSVFESANLAGNVTLKINGDGDLSIGALTFTPAGEIITVADTHTSYLQQILQNKSNGVDASTDLVVTNNLGTDSTNFGDFGINSSAFTGSGSLSLANATYLYSSNGDLVLGTFTANGIRFVVNNSATDAMFIDSNGRVNISISTAVRAGLNIGAFGVVPSSPVDGDIWKSAADTLLVRMSTNSRTVSFLEKAQSFTATQTFVATTATGVVTGRSFVATQQTNTPAGTTYAWVLTSGNALTLTLTSSTGDVIVTTSAPTSGAYSYIATVGHATLARNVSLTQSGVTWIYKGVATATTQLLGSIVATKSILFRLYWVSATVCYVERVASDDGNNYLGTTLNATPTAITAIVPIVQAVPSADSIQVVRGGSAKIANVQFQTNDSSTVVGSVGRPTGSTNSMSLVADLEYLNLSAATAGKGISLQTGGVERSFISDTAITTSVKVIGPACTTATATFNAPHGTAPSTPANGDMWTTTAGIFFRVNGATKTVTTT
jgi:hypothetical protein